MLLNTADPLSSSSTNNSNGSSTTSLLKGIEHFFPIHANHQIMIKLLSKNLKKREDNVITKKDFLMTRNSISLKTILCLPIQKLKGFLTLNRSCLKAA